MSIDESVAYLCEFRSLLQYGDPQALLATPNSAREPTETTSYYKDVERARFSHFGN